MPKNIPVEKLSRKIKDSIGPFTLKDDDVKVTRIQGSVNEGGDIFKYTYRNIFSSSDGCLEIEDAVDGGADRITSGDCSSDGPADSSGDGSD